MKNLIILVLSTLLLASCVSTKPASNISRAEKRIIKYNTGIQNQLEQFPSLADKAYRIKEIITVTIPQDSVKLNLLLQDIKKLNEVNSSINNVNVKLDSKLDSLSLLLDNVVMSESDKDFVNTLLSRIRKLNAENRLLFKKYQEASLSYQQGTYEDDTYIVEFLFKDGILSLDIFSKEKEIQVETDTQVFDINIKRHFWQDIKFWGFIIILINILYFFNSLIYKFLDSIFTSIIKFVRKLFIKI